MLKLTVFRSHIEHWILVHLCPNEYEHMWHLVDDVIRLERRCETISGSNDKTVEV